MVSAQYLIKMDGEMQYKYREQQEARTQKGAD
jgi:hypothetical protein